MLVGTPLVETEQDRSIRVDDLPEVVVGGSHFRQAKERLVPLEALRHVSMVGSDLQLDEGIGICGKEGQSVPVGVGIPTLKIDRMTLGGTA